jgi:hypothetical protein
MDRIDFDAHDRTRLQWAMVVAFGALDDKDAARLIRESRKEKGGYEVQLIINGVECSFKEIMERWDKHYDEAVEEDAKELVTEKMWYLDSLSDEIDHAKKEFERVIIGRLRDKAAPGMVFIGQIWNRVEGKFEHIGAFSSVEAARESFARSRDCDLEGVQVRDWDTDSSMIPDPSGDDRYFTQVISHLNIEVDMYLTESSVRNTEAERRSFPRGED